MPNYITCHLDTLSTTHIAFLTHILRRKQLGVKCLRQGHFDLEQPGLEPPTLRFPAHHLYLLRYDDPRDQQHTQLLNLGNCRSTTSKDRRLLGFFSLLRHMISSHYVPPQRNVLLRGHFMDSPEITWRESTLKCKTLRCCQRGIMCLDPMNPCPYSGWDVGEKQHSVLIVVFTSCMRSIFYWFRKLNHGSVLFFLNIFSWKIIRYTFGINVCIMWRACESTCKRAHS